jgi:diguanylate cyclase (GGDEF)-like protein
VPTRQLREEAARFKRLSETDPLTGVLNLRAFVARVTQALSDRPGRRGAMIFLDLNGFKEINDAYGHATGDRVLAHVADKLTFPPHTWIATARIGGDEFAMWMPGVLPENLENVIAGIRARLCVPVDVSDTSSDRLRIMATAAIGAACCPDEARSYEALRNLADKRMYQDKAQIRAAQSPFGTLK